MLQLSFSAQLLPATRQVQLVDTTPAYDALTAPGGYGGINPGRTDLVLLAIAGRQQPGSLRYDATLYADPGQSLLFSLPSDGLFVFWVLAAQLTDAANMVGLPVGTVVAERVSRQLYYIDASGSAVLLQASRYDFAGLRSFVPTLLPASEYAVTELATFAAQAAIDMLLLAYVRIASRNSPQGGYDHGWHWVQAQATLQSVQSLHKALRLPEAAQQLAALSALLHAPGQGAQRPITTDWLQQQLNPVN